MRGAVVQCALVVLLCSAASGCFYDRSDHAQACESERECPSDMRCYEGFCVSHEGGAGSCTQSSRIESCYGGEPAESAGVGSCKEGQRICVDGTYSECLGQVTPQPEVCNGRDDDCDGEVDDGVAASSACPTHLRGACSEGTLTCRNGVEFCQPVRESQAETCNAIDDDCDGVSDELATGACYPSGVAGCTLNAQSTWECNGLCTTGQASCGAGGELCEGAVTPVDEACTSGTMLAQDENCDGEIDEGCECTDGAPRPCYAGPIGTRGIGICEPGTQVCADSVWGPCVGQTLPSVETCDNPLSDDDCNDVEDDIFAQGFPCIALGESGECRNGTLECAGELAPECVGGEPTEELCDERDQDCDDDPTNGFDFGSDETCGSCDVKCDADETCCQSSCIEVASLDDDPDNCGACGRACGASRYCCQGDCLSAVGPMQLACSCDNACGDRSCCGESCRDLDNDNNNCGACGRKCGRDERCDSGTCRR